MTSAQDTANPFEAWQEMFRKSTEMWQQAAASGSPNPFWPPNNGGMPGMGMGMGMPGMGMPGAGMPGFGGFAPPFGGNDVTAMWQQFFNMWLQQWSQAFTAGAAPQTLSDVQKRWNEQLEAMAKAFADTMSTEDFARALGKYMEQCLHAQERMADAANPQIDAMLRTFNMPSRSQMNRLFVHVLSIEERLDDLEDEIRKLRREQEASRSGAGTGGRRRNARSSANAETEAAD